jgi:hypothetical protein
VSVDRDDASDPASIRGDANGHHEREAADRFRNGGESEVARKVESRGDSVRAGIVGTGGRIRLVRAGDDGVAMAEGELISSVRHQHPGPEARRICHRDDQDAGSGSLQSRSQLENQVALPLSALNARP